MGALLFTGLVCFGSTLGLGLLIARTVPIAERAHDRLLIRRLFVILLGYLQGITVLSVVVGLLAIVSRDAGGPLGAAFATVPAIIGGLLGLVVASRGDGVLRPSKAGWASCS